MTNKVIAPLHRSAPRRYDSRPFDETPFREGSATNHDEKISSSQVLTVAKSDVEWAAHLGRNVLGAIEKSVASD